MQPVETMTDETQVETPIEDAPNLPVEADADSSPAVETEVKADDTQPRDEEGKFLSRNAQKRIDELTWRASEREREAAYWRDLAMKQQTPEPKAEQPAKLPSLEEVGYDEAKYQAALIEYATKQAERVVEERLSKAALQQKEQARLSSFAERQRDFAKATPDFEDRVLRDPTLPITEAMRDVIIDSPAGPEVAYYLATNRELAEQISKLPAHMAALEMGRIEGRLAAQKAAPRPPVVSKAPPPPPTVETTGAEVAKDPESMTPDEWLKWRNKQLFKGKKK